MKTLGLVLYCAVLISLTGVWGALELNFPGLREDKHAADLKALRTGLQATPSVSKSNQAGSKGTVATYVFDHIDSIGHTTHMSYEAELKPNVIFVDPEDGWTTAQCKVLSSSAHNNGSANSTIISTTIASSQPCSSHTAWTKSSGHIVVINEHEGCASESDDSPQLILRLQNGSCSSTADGMTIITITGHAAESFDAFERLHLRLYRGPGSAPPGTALTLQQNSSAAEHSASDTGNKSSPAHSGTLSAAQVLGVAEGNTALTDLTSPQSKSVWSRFCRVAARLAQGLQLSRTKPRLEKPITSDAQPVLPQIPVGKQLGNSTIGRHLLASGCDSTCATCTGSDRSLCSTCYPGWVLYKGWTGNYCHDCNMPGYTCSLSNSYCSTQDSVCYYCDQSCATCSGGGSSDCLSCPSGLKLEGGQCVACTAPQSVPLYVAGGLEAYVTLDYIKVLAPQGWTDPVPTGLYFMSSHYDTGEAQLVTNQLTSGQNLPLPCVDTFGVQYNIINAIATLAYGESIRIGIYEPGGSGWFGLEDSSLGDAWVLNPVDFQNGNPSTKPGTVIIRPVTSESNGLHVEMSVTCVGCLSLAPTATAKPAIDKSHPVKQTLTPESIYNFNPSTGTAVSSIPLYQGNSVSLACTNCFLSLQQSGLYLAVTYNGNQDGFENIQVEADVSLLANIDLALSSAGTGQNTYTKQLVTNLTLLSISFPILNIGFTASIEASAQMVVDIAGAGGVLMTTGADASVAMQYGYSYDVNNGATPYSVTQTSQHSHTPAIKIPDGSTASFSTSVGFQPSLKAGLKGSVLWSVGSGYVYATASTLAHANLDIQISPSGWTVSRIPSTALVYGNCSASPAVVAQLYVGVDQAQLGMGLAAALLAGFPLIGWSYQKTWGPWPIDLPNQDPGVLWPVTQIGQACLCPVGSTECLINQALPSPPPPPVAPSPPPPPPQPPVSSVTVITASPSTSGNGNGSITAAFTVLLGGVSIVDFNAQRQAAFLQVTAGFMGISQTLLKFSSMNGIAFNSRRRLAASSGLTVGVTASGFDSTGTAGSAVNGFTHALNAGTLQSQMLSLSSLSISSVAYTEQPVISTRAASKQAVNAPPAAAASHRSFSVGAIVGVAVGGAVLAAAAALAAYCFVQKRRKAARAPSVPSARHINTEAEPVAQASAINATAAPVQPTDKPADVGAATHVTASANAGY